MHFEKLGLLEPLLKAVRAEGYTTATPIQAKAVPHVIAGKDLVGCAQTGTGKTAAFALPILQRLYSSAAPPASRRNGKSRHAPPRKIRAMVLSPTRELALQIGESFQAYGRHTGLRHAVIYGGVKQNAQVDALRKGVDILVATPGRLLDLMGQRILSLQDVEVFVLDEADRMLDMGFIHDIRRVIRDLPPKRQTLLFSATMPREIQTLVDTLLSEPVKVEVQAESPAADTVDQTLYYVDHKSKLDLLCELLVDPKLERTLVFSRTKHGADRIAKRLGRADIAAEAIHSNKSQNARQRALRNFKAGTTRVLVASDIAARGLDVDDISHVINFDLPHEAETYVHRIGRTGRAGAQGKAISFCCDEQRDMLRGIEKLLGRRIPVRKHSIKPVPSTSPPAGGQRVSSARKGKPGTDKGSQAPKTQAKAKVPVKTQAAGETSEQQKSEFWRRRRKPRPAGSAASSRPRRRRRR